MSPVSPAQPLSGYEIKRSDVCFTGDSKIPGHPVSSRLWRRLPAALKDRLKHTGEDAGRYDVVFDEIRAWYEAHPHPQKQVEPSEGIPIIAVNEGEALALLMVAVNHLDDIWQNAPMKLKLIGAQAIVDARRAEGLA